MSKELPQEDIIKRFTDIIIDAKEYSLEEDAPIMAVRCYEHIAPVLEAKNKEIADLKEKYDQEEREAEHWEEQFIMADAKLQAANEQIEKLKGLLKELYLNHKGVSIVMRCQHTKKLLSEVENEYWEALCKEHNITP